MAFTAVILIMMYIQEKMRITKLKRYVVRYLTLNVIVGYTLPLLLASIYVFGVAGFGFDVLIIG